jgi:hypothetical protein
MRIRRNGTHRWRGLRNGSPGLVRELVGVNSAAPSTPADPTCGPSTGSRPALGSLTLQVADDGRGPLITLVGEAGPVVSVTADQALRMAKPVGRAASILAADGSRPTSWRTHRPTTMTLPGRVVAVSPRRPASARGVDHGVPPGPVSRASREIVATFELGMRMGRAAAARETVEDALLWLGVSQGLATNPTATEEVLRRIVERLEHGGKDRRGAALRRVPAGLLTLDIVPMVAGAVGITELARAAPMSPDHERFFEMPAPVLLDIISASLYRVVAAFQFVPGLGRTHWHRIAGRALVPLGIAAEVSGLRMSVFYDLPATDDDLLRPSRCFSHRYSPGGSAGPGRGVAAGLPEPSRLDDARLRDRSGRRHVGADPCAVAARVWGIRRVHPRDGHGGWLGDQPVVPEMGHPIAAVAPNPVPSPRTPW